MWLYITLVLVLSTTIVNVAAEPWDKKWYFDVQANPLSNPIIAKDGNVYISVSSTLWAITPPISLPICPAPAATLLAKKASYKFASSFADVIQGPPALSLDETTLYLTINPSDKIPEQDNVSQIFAINTLNGNSVGKDDDGISLDHPNPWRTTLASSPKVDPSSGNVFVNVLTSNSDTTVKNAHYLAYLDTKTRGLSWSVAALGQDLNSANFLVQQPSVADGHGGIVSISHHTDPNPAQSGNTIVADNWFSEVIPGQLSMPAINIKNQRVYVAELKSGSNSDQLFLYAYDNTQQGKIVPSATLLVATLPHEVSPVPFYIAPTVADNGTVYLGNPELGELYALTDTGASLKLRWKINFGPFSIQQQPTVDNKNDIIYVVTSNGNLYALLDQNIKAEIKWCDKLTVALTAPIVAADGSVVIGSFPERVIAFVGGKGSAAKAPHC